MIVVDTSAWIELFRKSGHPVAQRLKALLGEKADIAITEVVVVELLAGAPSGPSLMKVSSHLFGLPVLRLEGVADFEEAALIYRRCRDAGHTLRSQLDCLIAVAVIRHGASLLHNDRDFEVIARCTTLKLEPLDDTGGPQSGGVRERAGRYARRVGQVKAPRRRVAGQVHRPARVGSH